MAEPKLSKKHREDVERAYQYEDAERPFLDYYKSELEQRLPKLLENQSPAEAQLPEEQQLASAVRWMLHGNGPFIRAVAKRLVEDSPGEMARSASLYARLEPWHGLLDEYDDFLNLTWSLFPALAAGDHDFAERYAAELPSFTEKGDKETRLLHNLFAAAILRDEDLLAAAVAAFDEWKKPKKTVAAMAEVFRALHRRDPGEVVRALEELLAMSRKIWHLFEVFNIVSFETHGLYELCRWIDPALVEGFETDRPLPWDSGLWRWVRDHDGESPFHDVSELSPVLQQWLVELPFKADREHYWPGGVREAPPPAPIDETPAPPISFDKSWRVVLTKHATQEIDKQYALTDTLFANEAGVSSYGTMLSPSQLPAGAYVPPRQPHVVGCKRAAQPWYLLAGERIDEDWVGKNGKRKRVQTVSVGYDAERSKTHFRLYDGGKIGIDFQATGAPDQPSKKQRLKSIEPLDGVVADGATPAETLEALLGYADARPMLVRLVAQGDKLRLVWQNGDAAPAANLDDGFEVKFYALQEGENPASDRLHNAIHDGDSDGVKQAIADGADLNWLPLSNVRPLDKAIAHRRGDWRGCARALVEAGAPVDGLSGESPPIIDAFSWVRHDTERLGQLNAIDAIDCLLDLGADINARDTSNHGEERTVLHRAARDHQTLIAAHLLIAGADAAALDGDGKTPLDIAERRAEQATGAAANEASRLAQLLRDWRDGRVDESGVQAFFDDELQKAEARRKEKLTQSNARITAMQAAVEISIKRLPDFGEADYAKPLVADLESEGFVKIGYYQINSAMRLRVIAFHHPERCIYGLVIIIARAALIDVMRVHNDHSATNVANSEFSNDYSVYARSHEDLPIRYHVVEEGSVADLLAKLDAIPPHESGAALVQPDELEDRLRRHHQLDVEGQARIANRILGRS